MVAATEPIVDIEPTDGLGPSVTAEFAGALPLEELVRAKPSRATAPVSAPAPASSLDPEIFDNTVKQIDTTLSALFGVEPEDPQELEPITKGLFPLAAHYTNETASVTTLWMVASLCFLSYATLKYQKIRQPEVEDDTEKSSPEAE